MEELSDAQVRRLRNLRLYKDMTDEQIRDAMRQKNEPRKYSGVAKRKYDERFREKFDVLKSEFGVDMNESNDREALSQLVRYLLQSEDLDRDIRAIMDTSEKNKDDIMILKNLGDIQRNVQMSISDLQEKLGISRKTRREKQVDDIPQFIDSILVKAKTFFDRETVTVDCPKCQIELVRYWLNFPDLTTMTSITTECPHCGETVQHNR